MLNNIYRDYLVANGVAPESIISFSLNKKKDAKFRNPIKLGEEIEKRAAQILGKKYLFIDEIGLCLPVPSPDLEGGEIDEVVWSISFKGKRDTILRLGEPRE